MAPSRTSSQVPTCFQSLTSWSCAVWEAATHDPSRRVLASQVGDLNWGLGSNLAQLGSHNQHLGNEPADEYSVSFKNKWVSKCEVEKIHNNHIGPKKQGRGSFTLCSTFSAESTVSGSITNERLPSPAGQIHKLCNHRKAKAWDGKSRNFSYYCPPP